MSMAAWFVPVNEKTIANLRETPDAMDDFLSHHHGDHDGHGSADDGEIGQSWHYFHFALSDEVDPEASVLSKAVLGGVEVGKDMGYGRARILMPEDVSTIAAALSKMDNVEMFVRDGNDASDNVLENFLAFVAFYQDTATRGDGVITWIVKPDFPVSQAMLLVPEKTSPPNLKSKTASAGFCYLLSALWVGMGVYIYTLHENKSAPLRLAEPTTIEVTFERARCYPDPYRKKRALMEQTYSYAPDTANALGKRYEVLDLVRQPSLETCELALPQATRNPPRSHVWYDKAVPAKARWDIDNDSPNFIIWFTLIGAGVLFAIGRSKHGKA
jgi:hypothetical protein